jgi:hypothetical protein
VWRDLGRESLTLIVVVTWPADVRFHLWRKLSEHLGIAIERNWLQRIDQLATGPIGQRLHAGEWMLLKRRGKLTWARAVPSFNNASVVIAELGTYERGGEQLIIRSVAVPSTFPQDPNYAVLDAEQVKFPWTWRYPNEQERFVPLGAPGQQTVIKHLAHRGVASQCRASTPVLADEVGIIWIPGFTLAQRVRINAASKSALALQLSLL